MYIRRDALDILFSQYIRLRDRVCQYCGRSGRLETSHFHSRRKRSVRFDPENSCALCFSCHTFLSGNPYAHTEFFKKRLGSERFCLLNIRAETIMKVDKEKVKEYLVELIEIEEEE